MSNILKSHFIRLWVTLGVMVFWTITSCSNSDLLGGSDQPDRRGGESSGGTNGSNSNTNNGTKIPGTNVPATPYPTANPVPVPVPVPVPTVAPITNDCYKASDFVCKVEHLITNKTNAYRATIGKPPLAYDAKMSFVARDWSAKQAAAGDISHSGFPAARSAVYMQEFKVREDFWAENVAMSGYGSGSSTDADAESIAQEFATMWWNSSGHRANMIGDYSKLGMGMAQNSSGEWYGTQIFQ